MGAGRALRPPFSRRGGGTREESWAGSPQAAAERRQPVPASCPSSGRGDQVAGVSGGAWGWERGGLGLAGGRGWALAGG